MRVKRTYQPVPEQNCGNCTFYKKHYIRNNNNFFVDEENGLCTKKRKISVIPAYSYKGADCAEWKAMQDVDATLEEIKEGVLIASEMLATLAKRINTVK